MCALFKKHTPFGIVTLSFLVLIFPENTCKKKIYLGCTCVSSHTRWDNKVLKELVVREKIIVKM